jgi:shikimate kinase
MRRNEVLVISTLVQIPQELALEHRMQVQFRLLAGRPLARDRARFEELHAERRPLYEGVADALLPRGGRERTGRSAQTQGSLSCRPPI